VFQHVTALFITLFSHMPTWSSACCKQVFPARAMCLKEMESRSKHTSTLVSKGSDVLALCPDTHAGCSLCLSQAAWLQRAATIPGATAGHGSTGTSTSGIPIGGDSSGDAAAGNEGQDRPGSCPPAPAPPRSPIPSPAHTTYSALLESIQMLALDPSPKVGISGVYSWRVSPTLNQVAGVVTKWLAVVFSSRHLCASNGMSLPMNSMASTNRLACPGGHAIKDLLHLHACKVAVMRANDVAFAGCTPWERCAADRQLRAVLSQRRDWCGRHLYPLTAPCISPALRGKHCSG
jgi:hypothetical protein